LYLYWKSNTGANSSLYLTQEYNSLTTISLIVQYL